MGPGILDFVESCVRQLTPMVLGLGEELPSGIRLVIELGADRELFVPWNIGVLWWGSQGTVAIPGDRSDSCHRQAVLASA